MGYTKLYTLMRVLLVLCAGLLVPHKTKSNALLFDAVAPAVLGHSSNLVAKSFGKWCADHLLHITSSDARKVTILDVKFIFNEIFKLFFIKLKWFELFDKQWTDYTKLIADNSISSTGYLSGAKFETFREFMRLFLASLDAWHTLHTDQIYNNNSTSINNTTTACATEHLNPYPATLLNATCTLPSTTKDFSYVLHDIQTMILTGLESTQTMVSDLPKNTLITTYSFIADSRRACIAGLYLATAYAVGLFAQYLGQALTRNLATHTHRSYFFKLAQANPFKKIIEVSFGVPFATFIAVWAAQPLLEHLLKQLNLHNKEQDKESDNVYQLFYRTGKKGPFAWDSIKTFYSFLQAFSHTVFTPKTLDTFITCITNAGLNLLALRQTGLKNPWAFTAVHKIKTE